MPKSLRSPRQKYLQDLLLKIRKVRKLTQIDVAERLSRPQSFVAKYEGGERRLDVIVFIEVAQALEADPCAVLSDVLKAEIRSPPRSRAARVKQK